MNTASQLLAPFVPRLLFSWEDSRTQAQHRALEGSLAFVDISGFTKLTEQLAQRGKAGAEEMSDLLDAIFSELLAVASEYDASLVKWGGDALLLLFQGAEHAAAAARGCAEMMLALERVGRLQTSVGDVTLRMSVGIHSGTFDFVLGGYRHRELLITGPGATVTALMEQTAEAGEIVMSPEAAAMLPASARGPVKGTGVLLAVPPEAYRRPGQYDHDPGDLDVTPFVPEAIRAFLLAQGGEGEHRRVAVAFVEFTGVDAIVEKDGPQAAAEALDHLIRVTQDATARHRVTFFETDIAPDGGKIMLVSGAPRGVGSSEQRLLHVARAIVDDPGRLRVRVGVNSGRVFAGGFGPDFRRTYSVKGDAINLAARVMGRASTGEVWVTQAALERCPGVFNTEPIEPFSVKGKTAPVRAHRVLGAAGVVAHGQEEAKAFLPLLGRQEELGLLLDGAESAAAGSGAVAVVVGEPGIGKSRLTTELRRRSPISTIAVTCEEYEAATPYASARRLVRDILGIPLDADRQGAAAGVVELVRRHAPELEPALALIGAVVDADLAESLEVSTLDEQFRRQRIEQATVELLERVRAEPTVIVVEDAHLADDSSAALFRAMCLRASATPWLMLITRRDQPGGLVAPEDAYPVELRLAPLPKDVASELVDVATEDMPLPEHVMAALVERSGGNPLFLKALVVAARSDAAETLPDTVEGVIGTQIDRLPPADRSLLRAASALGMRFDPQLLTEVLELESQKPAFGAWRRLALFVQADGESMRFVHALVRDTAYEGLSFRRRVRLHELIGESIERRAGGVSEDNAELLALHFAKAEKFDSAWFYARIAGDRAVDRYAYVEAAEFYAAASDAGRRQGVPDADLAAVFEKLGGARYALAEFAAAGRAYERAWNLSAADGLVRARLALQCADAAFHCGDLPAALQWLDRGQDAITGSEESAAAKANARLLARRASMLHQQGDHEAAEQVAQDAIRTAEASGAKDALAMAYTALDLIDLMKGRFGVAPEDVPARRALDLWQELADLPWQAKTRSYLGARAYWEGRWDEAIEMYEASRATYEQIGDSFNAAMELGNIAEIAGQRGDPPAAVEMLRDVLRAARAAKDTFYTAFWQGMRARFLARAGDPTTALEQLNEVAAEMDSQGMAVFKLEAEARTAECLVILEQPAEAVELATALLRRCEALPGSATILPLLHRVLGYGLAQQERPAEAHAAFLTSLDAARQQHMLQEVAFSLDALRRLGDLQPDLRVDGVEEEAARLCEQLQIRETPHYSVGAAEQARVPRQTVLDETVDLRRSADLRT